MITTTIADLKFFLLFDNSSTIFFSPADLFFFPFIIQKLHNHNIQRPQTRASCRSCPNTFGGSYLQGRLASGAQDLETTRGPRCTTEYHILKMTGRDGWKTSEIIEGGSFPLVPRPMICFALPPWEGTGDWTLSARVLSILLYLRVFYLYFPLQTKHTHIVFSTSDAFCFFC